METSTIAVGLRHSGDSVRTSTSYLLCKSFLHGIQHAFCPSCYMDPIPASCVSCLLTAENQAAPSQVFHRGASQRWSRDGVLQVTRSGMFPLTRHENNTKFWWFFKPLLLIIALACSRPKGDILCLQSPLPQQLDQLKYHVGVKLEVSQGSSKVFEGRTDVVSFYRALWHMHTYNKKRQKQGFAAEQISWVSSLSKWVVFGIDNEKSPNLLYDCTWSVCRRGDSHSLLCKGNIYFVSGEGHIYIYIYMYIHTYIYSYIHVYTYI
jgi:hypothetical protein